MKVLAIGLVLAALANAPALAGEWKSDLEVYLWATGISGQVGAGDTETHVDLSFSDVVQNLKFGARAPIRVAMGAW